VNSSIKFFRDEYEEHVRLGRCPLGADGRRAREAPMEAAPAADEAPSAVSVAEVLE